MTSPDGYVRISISGLAEVRLTHLVSEKDMSIAVPPGMDPGGAPTGITEWVGSYAGMTLSLGWDWGMLQGVLVVLNPNEIRTNILLLSDEGRALQPAVARIRLLDRIESLPWREAVSDELKL